MARIRQRLGGRGFFFWLGGIFTAVVVFVVALTTILGKVLTPLVDASESFLRELGEGKVHQAYTETSGPFRAGVSEAGLAQYVAKNGLRSVEGFGWYNRALRNGTGDLRGTIKLAGGKEMPVKVLLKQEGETWKVHHLMLGEEDAADFKARAEIPDQATLTELSKKILTAFAQGIQAKDFTAFTQQAFVSNQFREQIPAARLKEIFHQFLERQIDITPSLDRQPTFDPAPAFDEKGVLTVTGSYPHPAGRLLFEYQLIERDGWKLLGINLRIKGRQ